MRKTICLLLSLLILLSQISIISADTAYDINDCVIDVYNDVLIYDGKEKTTEVRVIYEDELLTLGEDYTVSFENNTGPGIATIKISGAGRFGGEVQKPLRIVDKSITPIDSGTCGESVTWAVDKNYVLLISGKGEMENYTTQKRPPWINIDTKITGVIVDDGVQSIGDLAFYGFYDMEYIYIGNSVKSIGRGAISSNYMRSVSIPDSVEVLGNGAVSDSNIEMIHIGNHVKSLGENFFNSDIYLQSVILPESLQEIKKKAFFSCQSLKNVYFTGDAPIMESFAFPFDPINVYYPSGNITWNAGVRDQFRELNWIEWLKGDVIDISTAEIFLTGNTMYTGNPVCPDVIVYLENHELDSARYTVTFENNIDVGTASVIITGIGSYKGTIVKTFEIYKSPHQISIEKDIVEMDTGNTLSLNVSGVTGTLNCISLYPDFADAEVRGNTLIISAKRKGRTVITLRDSGGRNYDSSEIKIVVAVRGEDHQQPKPSEISLNTRYIETATETARQLTLSIAPVMADQAVIWKSSNENIAVVNDGKVKALRYGTAIITATSVSNPSLSVPCFIQTKYYDVNDTGLYYYKPVYWAADNNITKGYDNVYFGPKNNCTREAVVTFLWRAAGQPSPWNMKSPFKDVQDQSKYYYKAVLWAAETGITNGYSDGTFRPHDTCLREHVVTFLWRFAGQPDPKAAGNPFNDVRTSDYYYKASLWANKNGIANGYSSGPHKGGFGPKLDCLREHVVTFLFRFGKENYIVPSALDDNSHYLVAFNTMKEGVNVPAQWVAKGSKANKPYVRDNYKIWGWFKEPEYKNYFDFSRNEVTSDMTLYAKWFKDDFIDVTKYSYEVYPILSPYCYYVYVKTDNPDPESFILNDPDSKYWTSEIMSGRKPKSFYSIYNNSAEKVTEFSDVVYENLETHRVKGGYIFEAPECLPDGGKLVVQQRVPDYTHLYIDFQAAYADTDIIVECPELKTASDEIIDTYTDPNKSLFENLDSVQNVLEKIAVYPHSIGRSEKPNKNRPYPFITYSSFDEGYFDLWYRSMYEEGSLLAAQAYPYRLSSYGFPGMIKSIAETLEPDCQVANGKYHFEIDVTYNGITKTYGGAGGYDRPCIIYTSYAASERKYLFDHSQQDVFSNADLNYYHDLLAKYNGQAYEDADLYEDLINGRTFRKMTDATGGTWIRTGKEGGNIEEDRDFTYVLNGYLLRNVFVDGRYINDRGHIQYGAEFTEYPNANIVVPDMHYTDINGVEHTENVAFYYKEERDKWFAIGAYSDNGSLDAVPEEFTLTREQIAKMNVDGNTYKVPETCLIYDGTEFPGTPSLEVPHVLTSGMAVESIIYSDGSMGYDLMVKDSGNQLVYEGFEWSADRTDGLIFYSSGFFKPTASASGTYVFTCKPLPGASNISGEVRVEFRP